MPRLSYNNRETSVLAAKAAKAAERAAKKAAKEAEKKAKAEERAAAKAAKDADKRKKQFQKTRSVLDNALCRDPLLPEGGREGNLQMPGCRTTGMD